MDWDYLRYFLAVATTGSLLQAARKLGVNHSTVFRRINRLEEIIGVRLFDRLSEGYRLTQAGEQLLSHTERIGSEVDLLQLELSGQDIKPSGVVRVTAPENLAYQYLPTYLTSFAQAYPDIMLEIVVGSERLDLTRREADIAVRVRYIEKNLSDYVVARCSNLNSMSAMAEAGFGIAVMPDDQIKPQLRRLFSFKPRFVSDI
jgi:molybdate transport repressor ModE-like protein